VGEFARDTAKDLSKTAANRQSRQLHQGTAPDIGTTVEKLRRDKPDKPRGPKGTVEEDLESSRPAFRKFLLNLGDRRRQRNVTRTRQGKGKKKEERIPQNLTGKALADALRQQDIEGLGFKGPMGRG